MIVLKIEPNNKVRIINHLINNINHIYNKYKVIITQLSLIGQRNSRSMYQNLIKQNNNNQLYYRKKTINRK